MQVAIYHLIHNKLNGNYNINQVHNNLYFIFKNISFVQILTKMKILCIYLVWNIQCKDNNVILFKFNYTTLSMIFIGFGLLNYSVSGVECNDKLPT